MSADLWRWRRAAPVRRRDRIVLAVLVGAGFLSIARFADWWFRAEHIGQPVLYVLLSLAIWYGIFRVAVRWINALGIARPDHVDPEPDLSVAIFTTSSPGEPLAMFDTTLAACARIRYPHTTYLLDDTEDPRFREVAEKHGAVWTPLVGLPGAKAGKINRALEMTDEEFILVLDPDHIPFPNLLDRVLGHFQDPDVAYVQVSQAYYNQSRSFVARAAAEQTYAFYGPTQMGLHGHGACVAIGANCTFRRQALASIGGHGIGLAEDLVTAIRIHARGWRSVYVPEIVSRGLVPEELGSYDRQQLKWSRGVYEVLFSELVPAFGRLGWRQRLAYFSIGSYYLVGATTLVYLAIPYLYLWSGAQPTRMRFSEFLLTGSPIALIGVLIYLFVQRWMCHPEVERGLHWRGTMLKIATWPIYLWGTLAAIVRADIPYIPTAKEAVRGRFLRLAWPNLLVVVVYAVTLARVTATRLFTTPEGALILTSEAVWGMMAFATLSVVTIAGGLRAAWQAERPPAGAAWDDLDLGAIETT